MPEKWQELRSNSPFSRPEARHRHRPSISTARLVQFRLVTTLRRTSSRTLGPPNVATSAGRLNSSGAQSNRSPKFPRARGQKLSRSSMRRGQSWSARLPIASKSRRCSWESLLPCRPLARFSLPGRCSRRPRWLSEFPYRDGRAAGPSHPRHQPRGRRPRRWSGDKPGWGARGRDQARSVGGGRDRGQIEVNQSSSISTASTIFVLTPRPSSLSLSASNSPSIKSMAVAPSRVAS